MLEQTTAPVSYDAKEVSRLNKIWTNYHSAGQKWRTRGREYEALVYNDIEGTGTHFTREQLDKLEKKYGIPLSVNICLAIKEQLQAFLTGVAPSIDVIPVGSYADKHLAYVWREWIKGALRFNKFAMQQEKAIGDMTTVGHGVLSVEPNRFFSYNEFNTVIKRLRWEFCYFDPCSKDRLFQDSEAQIIAVPLTKSRAKKEYKLTDEEMRFASLVSPADSTVNSEEFNPTTFAGIDADTTEPKIWVFEFFEKVNSTIYILEDGTRTCKRPTGAYVNTDGKLIYPNVIASYDGVFIQRTLKVGNLIKYRDIMPITRYPLIPYVAGHNDTPFTYGIMHHIADIMHALNKILAITIENAQRGSNVGTWAPEGSIANEDEFEYTSSVPGGVSYYIPDPSLPNAGRPEPKVPAQLSNAWFTLFEQLVKLMEYITGIFDIMQGSAQNAPETATAHTQLTNFGTQRVKMQARNLDWSNEELLNLMIEFIQAYAPPGNLMRYLADSEALMEIRTNVAGTVQQSEQGTQFIEQEGASQMATLINNMTTDKVQAILGDIKVGEYRAAYRSGDKLPTTKLMALEIIKSVMGRMSSDATSIALMKMALNLMDYPEIDKLLRETDIIEQLQQQVEMLTQQNQDLQKVAQKSQGEAQSAKEQVMETEVGAELQKIKAKTDAALAQIKAAQQAGQRAQNSNSNNNTQKKQKRRILEYA